MKLRNAEAITIHIYMQSGHCFVSYCSYTYTKTHYEMAAFAAL